MNYDEFVVLLLLLGVTYVASTHNTHPNWEYHGQMVCVNVPQETGVIARSHFGDDWARELSYDDAYLMIVERIS